MCLIKIIAIDFYRLMVKQKSILLIFIFNKHMCTGHVQNPPAIKTHPVKFENILPIEGKG